MIDPISVLSSAILSLTREEEWSTLATISRNVNSSSVN
jgi:hypothetical protein